ncbi:MAG: ABC transporter permease [Rhodospirillales bacterium]
MAGNQDSWQKILNRIRYGGGPVKGVLVIVVVWELAVSFFDIPEYLLPAPTAIFGALVSNFGRIFTNVSITAFEAICGFFIGNALAVVFALIFSNVRSARESFLPLVVGLQAVPIVAIAPFIMIWFGSGYTGKIVMAALICYFPATVVATRGFLTVSSDAHDVLSAMGATRFQIFRTLALPSAIPSVFSAMELSAILCAIGALVAELSGASRGAGFLIIEASYSFKTSMLFAVLVSVAVFTVGWFSLVRMIGDRLSAKYRLTSVSLN